METVENLRKRTESNLFNKIKNEYNHINRSIEYDIEEAANNGKYWCNIKIFIEHDENKNRIIKELSDKGFNVRYYEGIKKLEINWSK
jgi:hypothetical protein